MGRLTQGFIHRVRVSQTAWYCSLPAKASNMASGFLTLPWELRFRIYRALLETPGNVICPGRAYNPETKVLSLPRVKWSYQRRVTILLTCRQVYNEANKLFRSRTTCLFVHRCSFTHLFNAIPSGIIENIQTLILDECQDVVSWQPLPKLLDLLPVLRTFILHAAPKLYWSRKRIETCASSDKFDHKIVEVAKRNYLKNGLTLFEDFLSQRPELRLEYAMSYWGRRPAGTYDGVLSNRRPLELVSRGSSA